jgi:hypothetical protein
MMSPGTAGSSPAFNEAPILVDFDHYGNTATERFSMSMPIMSAPHERSERQAATGQGMVEEVVAIAERCLGVLVDRDDDRLDMSVAVALARRLMPDIGETLYPRRAPFVPPMIQHSGDVASINATTQPCEEQRPHPGLDLRDGSSRPASA